MRIFFSAGEPSGDHHAGQLITELRRRHSDVECTGFGGPQMQAAGLDCVFQLTDLAVMGVAAVLPLLGKFYRLLQEARTEFRKRRPDAVVLVDFPGFNWWVAKAAKREGIPVYYYCPPQLWAWGGWRISKVRRYIDCVLSVLPFEADWYRKRGVDVEFVGHPFFDDVAAHSLHAPTLERLKGEGDKRLALLPGSRKSEVEQNFPVMLEMVRKLHQRHPKVRFPVACYREWHLERCQNLAAEITPELPLDFYVGKTPEVLAAADCCLMVSGSVSLELLARRVPAVVLYRGSWLMWVLAQTFMTCKYISLPNLMAGRELMPEFPFVSGVSGKGRQVIDQLDCWLSNPGELSAARQALDELALQSSKNGGINRAADVLCQRLGLEVRQQHPTARRAA
jgi:lipid-A-disaccharide synthase